MVSREVRFSDLLRSYRTARGLSMSALARAAGLSYGHVSRLERDERWPSRLTVLKLARALGLTDTERDRLLLAARFAPLAQLNTEQLDECGGLK
jgi:transcriptional regulator with XRE-family HTH domain